ncbi:MAG TPA: CBS domain-containing protein, partial [Armatimonadota bacterium]|nr:CBS domain-containing protein [Armatimonadota bacterium]
TEQFWSVKPNDSVDTVIDKMEEGHVRRLPVVDTENHVMGVIAMADVAQEVDEEEVVAEVVEEVSKPTGIPHA